MNIQTDTHTVKDIYPKNNESNIFFILFFLRKFNKHKSGQI